MWSVVLYGTISPLLMLVSNDWEDLWCDAIRNVKSGAAPQGMWWRWLSAVGVFFSEMKCACSAKTTTKSTTSHLHTSSLRFIAASYQVLFTFFYLHLWHLRFESKEVWKDLVLFRAATKYSFHYWFLYVYIFFICFVWSTTRLVYKMSEYSEKCKSWQSDVF